VGDSPVAVAYQHVREEPQPPSLFDPEITPEMDAIVLKALVKDPNYRYQSADEMRADIEACLDGQPVAATAALGAVGYGGYPDDQPTTALRTDPGAGATSMLPPMNPDDGGFGYDDRPARRRQQKKSNTSTILLVVAGVLVLVGAILIGKWMFGGGNTADSNVPVPNFIGSSLEDAKKLAVNSDLKLTTTKKPCENQTKGNVCKQDPAAKTEVEKGSTVNLTVSTGAPKVAVPSVIGDKLDDAKDELEGDKYQFKVVTKTEVSDEDPNTVLKQDPELGKEVQKGSTITLTIAKAAAKSTVPDVTGQSCDAARAQMTANNLTGNCVEVETDDDSQVNKVINTSPAAGAPVDKNSSVTINIGKAAADKKFAMPKLTQMTLGQAKQVIAQNGLQLGNVQGSQDDNAVVFAQDPQEGKEVKQGDTVNLGTADAGNNGGNNGGTNIFGGATG